MPTTSSGLWYPDGNHPADLSFIVKTAQESVQTYALGQTTGTPRRMHRVAGLTQTTNTTGYATFAHGAPFTPSLVQAFIHRSGTTFCQPISVDNITATQVTVRFLRWDTGALADTISTNGSLALVCWE